MLLTPVPTRVTISVSDDLHRAIQALRGRILMDDGADLAYSLVVEVLARQGILEYAEGRDKLVELFKKRKMDVSRLSAPGLSKTNRILLRRAIEEPLDQALGYSPGGFPDAFLTETLPVLIKAAKVKYRDDEVTRIRNRSRARRLGPQEENKDAPVAQGSSAAVGTAEEGVGHPPGAPSK